MACPKPQTGSHRHSRFCFYAKWEVYESHQHPSLHRNHFVVYVTKSILSRNKLIFFLSENFRQKLIIFLLVDSALSGSNSVSSVRHLQSKLSRVLMNLGDLDIQPEIYKIRLENANLYYISEILITSQDEIIDILNITPEECNRFIQLLKSVCPIPQPLLLDKVPHVSLDDCLVAQFFGNVLSVGHIIEFTGPSGTGKTQLSMELALKVQLPLELGGLNGGCVYITTTSRFCIKRFAKIGDLFAQRHKVDFTCLANNVHLIHILDLDSLEHILRYQLPAFVEMNQIRLIVIDSISSNFRTDQDSCDFFDKTRRLCDLMSGLKKLAFQSYLTCVCINEVTANFSEGLAISSSNNHESAIYYQRERKSWDVTNIPALGNSFATCINTRCHFQKQMGEEFTSRSLHIDFSPLMRRGSLIFEIKENGFKGISLLEYD